MSDQVPSQLPAFLFAMLVALLLFGAFINRTVRQSLALWWRNLDSRAAGRSLDPELLPKRDARPLPFETGGERASRPHREQKEAPFHRSSPHVEKKEAPLHRTG